MEETPHKLSIVELCLSKAWGGIEHRFCDDVIWLLERGHRVIPVVSPNTHIKKYLESVGIDPVVIRSRDYFDPFASLRMARLFKRNHVNALHIHRTQDLGVPLLATCISSVPVRLLTLRMESKRLKKDIYHRWIYSRLSVVLTLTDRMRRLVQSNVAVDQGKVLVLPNGIDIDKINSETETRNIILAKWGVAADSFVVGMVGRLEQGKGQHVLLKAAAKLGQRVPKLTIMLVGDETVDRQGELKRLKQIAEQLPSDIHTVFTGYQRPPGSIVPAFDVSILASRKETFGVVIIEAMALKIPVIATDAGGVTEIIEHRRNGLLVPPEDEDQLAEAIEELYTDSILRRKIAAAGYQTVKSRFSREVHISRLESALNGHFSELRLPDQHRLRQRNKPPLI